MEIPILEGNKVMLRPIQKQDIKSWVELAKDEKMHKWVIFPNTYEEIEAIFFELYPKIFLTWMIIEKKTSEVIGMMRISHPDYENGLKVAGDSQRLHSNYWRRGYMKESRFLVYNYVFNELDVDVLYADAWKDNINSCKSLESVGYQLIDTKLEHFKKQDKMFNKNYYKLTKEVWKNANIL